MAQILAPLFYRTIRKIYSNTKFSIVFLNVCLLWKSNLVMSLIYNTITVECIHIHMQKCSDTLHNVSADYTHVMKPLGLKVLLIFQRLVILKNSYSSRNLNYFLRRLLTIISNAYIKQFFNIYPILSLHYSKVPL